MKHTKRQLTISLYHLSPSDIKYGSIGFVGIDNEEGEYSITFYGIDGISDLDISVLSSSVSSAIKLAKDSNFDSVCFDQRAARIAELPYYKSHWMQRWSEYGVTMSYHVKNQIDIIHNARL